ncbi:MAG: hypothetical protein HC839_04895 [Leptolyngbyaceae cyanobacterium RM2_2_21]|nr:hypothetical protein [Leptolyngbyaceae cyanobacterium RM2_2_21]
MSTFNSSISNQSASRRQASPWLRQSWRLLTMAACLAIAGFSAIAAPAIADDDEDDESSPDNESQEGALLPQTVTIYGNPLSSISSGVAIPPNTALYFSSGIVPPTVDTSFPNTNPARYCGTALPEGVSCLEAQAFNTLMAIEGLLTEAGLTKEDVIYVNAFLIADPETDVFDWGGWFDAYSRFFFDGTPAQDNLRLSPPGQLWAWPDWC